MLRSLMVSFEDRGVQRLTRVKPSSMMTFQRSSLPLGMFEHQSRSFASRSVSLWTCGVWGVWYVLPYAYANGLCTVHRKFSAHRGERGGCCVYVTRRDRGFLLEQLEKLKKKAGRTNTSNDGFFYVYFLRM